MKNKSKIIIAISLTLLLSIVSLNVWAAPQRQGTVPIIPVTGGTFTVNLLCDCTQNGEVTRINDPETEVAPAPTGFEFLSDTFKMKNFCDVEICYPYPDDYKSKKGQIYIWDEDAKEWSLTEATIYEETKQICTVVRESLSQVYSLISSDKITSPISTSKVTLCGCSADDTIQNVEDPVTVYGDAPEDLTILTNATKVDCSTACEVNVCYPYTAEYKAQEAEIYQWNEGTKSWVLVASTVKTEGDTVQICTVDKASVGGVYTLVGK